MSNTRWDEPLLRSVAVLQTQRNLLDRQADELTDLADMQAHRAIRSDLADYIAAHARAGTLPADPLATLDPRLWELSEFFDTAASLHRTSLELKLRSSSFSLADLQTAKASLEEAAAQLPARLQALATLLSPLDWNGSDDDADLHPELLLCAQWLDVDLPEETDDRPAFRLLALGGGRLFQEIKAHFKKECSRLAELAERHARHREALQQAAAQIALGNHLTARQLLEAAGLLGSSNHFSDLDYAAVQSSLTALQGAAAKAVGFARKLPANVWDVLERFRGVAASADRVAHHSQARQELAAIREALNAHWMATVLPGSELEAQCRPPLESAYSELSRAEAELDSMAAAGKAKRKSMWIKSGALAAIAMVLVPVAWFSYVKITAKDKPTADAKGTAKATAAADAAKHPMAKTWAAMRRAGFKEEKIKQTLTQGGTVVAWGRNDDGQCKVPVALSGVVAIAAGHEHTVALKLPPAAPAVRP